MKKVTRIVLIVCALSLTVASCKSSQKCAAYGETHRYKVDRNF